MQESSDDLPWWARYLLGIFLFWFAIRGQDALHASGWMAIGAAILGAFMMYEILIGIILCAIAWALWGAIAGIPVSVAVIIGALIIAGSNK